MSGFLVARGEGEQEHTVFYAQADDTLIHPKRIDTPFSHQWKCKKKRKTCNGSYKWFLRLVGVKLKPGEGPVFVVCRRLK